MKISVSIRAANLVWPVTLDCGFHPPRLPLPPLRTEAPLYPVASLFMCARTDAHKNRGPTCTQQSRAFIGHFNGGAQTVASLLCSPSSAVHSSSSSSSSASLFTKQHWTPHSRPEEKEQNLQGAFGGLGGDDWRCCALVNSPPFDWEARGRGPAACFVRLLNVSLCACVCVSAFLYLRKLHAPPPPPAPPGLGEGKGGGSVKPSSLMLRETVTNCFFVAKWRHMTAVGLVRNLLFVHTRSYARSHSTLRTTVLWVRG